MLIALDPEFKTAREVPDIPLDTFVRVCFPVLAAKAKVKYIYWGCSNGRILFDLDARTYQLLPVV